MTDEACKTPSTQILPYLIQSILRNIVAELPDISQALGEEGVGLLQVFQPQGHVGQQFPHERRQRDGQRLLGADRHA